ncbi:hypothetical protein DFJ58DRAFT_839688 [Suillus subalutaceus]|uniref:uncharacterized protein n=1 Tax=Suillus subalutaceus TaxID=48586 RepID=UPI001B86AC0D|nr:uncharacterized protein DFJ58DRAFT_839688 [Suillus subalutaceus]KAG1861552.1 hypothetical protein DFJ58DRAFT_839688 [Suillus subalutaceus]
MEETGQKIPTNAVRGSAVYGKVYEKYAIFMLGLASRFSLPPRSLTRMLELDEQDELLTKSFAIVSHRDGLRSNDTPNGHVHADDAGRSEVLSSHPLRRSSVSSCTAKNVGGIQTTLSEDVSDCPAAIEASADTTNNLDAPNQHDIDDILHTVSPHDSLVAIALRYGVSLSALRHANQLWPSDPIHLRTQLIIPRHHSLSSRISATDEELELENFLKPRLQSRTPEMDNPNTPAVLGVELDTLSHSRRSYIPAHDITSLLDHAPSPVSCQQLRNLTSDPTIRPFASDHLQTSKHSFPAPVFVPVRISQLEPEPAMELPVLKKHSLSPRRAPVLDRHCAYLWVLEYRVDFNRLRTHEKAYLTPDFATKLEVGEPMKNRAFVVPLQPISNSLLRDMRVLRSLINLMGGRANYRVRNLQRYSTVPSEIRIVLKNKILQ